MAEKTKTYKLSIHFKITGAVAENQRIVARLNHLKVYRSHQCACVLKVRTYQRRNNINQYMAARRFVMPKMAQVRTCSNLHLLKHAL